MQNNFQTIDNNLGAPAYIGSMQKILSEHIGEPIIVEFLVGTDNLLTKAGILYDVGDKYLVLYNTTIDAYIVADIFNVKFATFSQRASATNQVNGRNGVNAMPSATTAQGNQLRY